jgi:hypothetical protein
LEYLFHMWNVNEEEFHVGVHKLTLEIDDIYFLTGLSCRGSWVSLFVTSISYTVPLAHFTLTTSNVVMVSNSLLVGTHTILSL